ncbi:hypothetical protein WISP_82481 [Willisornis vidua]|uniref:AMRA1 protein n=1 Tax=Willisornis vidua TaxID=1566151 RepID=A0ABQ9D439_9PASS|nr:hypothetical protein WISP_82481 [Willisornis vidua]
MAERAWTVTVKSSGLSQHPVLLTLLSIRDVTGWEGREALNCQGTVPLRLELRSLGFGVRSALHYTTGCEDDAKRPWNLIVLGMARRHTSVNVLVQNCKIYNDASCDISADGQLLAAFIPSSQRGFPDEGILAVYSLAPHNLGEMLYTKRFGPNAISVSLSPMGRYVMVGLASRRILLHPSTEHMVAQVFRLQQPHGGETSMRRVFNVLYPMPADQRRHVSINSARWLPEPGLGLAYGTNKGDLVICRPEALNSGVDYHWDQLNENIFAVHSSSRNTERPGTSRATWRTDRDMGLMNAIGLQPRNPPTSVTSQGTQTLAPQLQNAETQTEREVQEQESASAGTGEVKWEIPDLGDFLLLISAELRLTSVEGEGPEYGAGGEYALSRIHRLMAEGGMTAVVQREQSTTMASMGGFGNNIIVSHRIHRSSQTGVEPTGGEGTSAQQSTSQQLATELEGRILSESVRLPEHGLSPRTAPSTSEGQSAGDLHLPEQAQSSMDTEGPIDYSDLTNNNHLPDSTNFYSNDSTSGESRNSPFMPRELISRVKKGKEACSILLETVSTGQTQV